MIDKPPGLPFLIVFSTAAITFLIWVSDPSWPGFETFVYGIPIGFLLFAYWAIRMTWADYKGTAPDGTLNRSLMPWYISGAVMLALVTGAPFWIRFTVSESSLEAYVRAVNENPGGKESCQWAGLYRVCAGKRHQDLSGKEIPGSAEFAVRDIFLNEDKGFLWSPSGEPDENADGGISYTHLRGRWYGYRWDDR
ncbi:hypothetical protein [Planomonospora algeriensis]